MIANIVLLVCAILTISASCTPAEISSGLNLFANGLYNVLPKNDSNLMFSPISVHAALSLAYQGAGNRTARSFQRSLRVPEIKETALGYKNIMSALNSVEKVNINIANKIYVNSDYKLKEGFSTVARDYFSADAQSIDFQNQQQASQEINEWVKEKTENKIDKLVSPDDFDQNTRAVLLNAIYFKGNWYSKFYPEDTFPAKFYAAGGGSTDCEMMLQVNDFDYAEDAHLDARILKMKYEDERFAMVVVLPNSKDGIGALEGKLAQKDISSIVTRKQKVEVTLPKFKFETTLRLKEPLIQIGLGEIFSNSADFSNLLDTPEKISVDKVIQKAVIEVNEEGSEAAAATAVFLVFRSMPPPRKVFQADHPFMFYITAELGEAHPATNILFMGKVVSPS